MKFLLIATLFLSFSSLAMLKKATIDGALSQKFDENYQETERSLAGQSDALEEKSFATKEAGTEKAKASAKEKEIKGERVPSSQGPTFNQVNENGIRYWKY